MTETFATLDALAIERYFGEAPRPWRGINPRHPANKCVGAVDPRGIVYSSWQHHTAERAYDHAHMLDPGVDVYGRRLDRVRKGNTPGAPFAPVRGVPDVNGRLWGVWWDPTHSERRNIRIVCQDPAGVAGGASYSIERRDRKYTIDRDLERIAETRPEVLILADCALVAAGAVTPCSVTRRRLRALPWGRTAKKVVEGRWRSELQRPDLSDLYVLGKRRQGWMRGQGMLEDVRTAWPAPRYAGPAAGLL